MQCVLVTGTSGLVGSRIYDRLSGRGRYKVIGTSRSPGQRVDIQIDLASNSSVEHLASFCNPEVIIHTAAIARTDLCAQDPERCRAVNATAVRHLRDLFPESKFMFFSTYAVYNTTEGNSDEKTSVTPTNPYISFKIEAEEALSPTSDAVIFRPSVIFGYHNPTQGSGNYFMQLLESIKTGNVMRSPSDQFFNPVHVNIVSAIVEGALEKDLHGVYNIGANEAISKYEFNRCIMERFGFDLKYLKPIEGNALAVSRPVNGTISSRKIQQDLGCRIPSLGSMIESLYDEVAVATGKPLPERGCHG